MSDRVSEWVGGLVGGWVIEWVNVCEWVSVWVSGWVSEWVGECVWVDDWVSECGWWTQNWHVIVINSKIDIKFNNHFLSLSIIGFSYYHKLWNVMLKKLFLQQLFHGNNNKHVSATEDTVLLCLKRSKIILWWINIIVAFSSYQTKDRGRWKWCGDHRE